MNDNKNESAFPVFLQEGLSCNSHVDVGLTKREYFAGLAMQGLLTNYFNNLQYGNHTDYPMVHEIAVRCADDLLLELSKENENEI